MAHIAYYNTSDSNTGNTVLGAGASITPLVLQATTEGTIVGTVISDQAGTLNIDQSFDGVNWDVTNAISVTAATGAGQGIAVNQVLFAPYVQARYTNTSGSAQTYLRLFLRAVGIRTP